MQLTNAMGKLDFYVWWLLQVRIFRLNQLLVSSTFMTRSSSIDLVWLCSSLCRRLRVGPPLDRGFDIFNFGIPSVVYGLTNKVKYPTECLFILLRTPYDSRSSSRSEVRRNFGSSKPKYGAMDKSAKFAIYTKYQCPKIERKLRYSYHIFRWALDCHRQVPIRHPSYLSNHDVISTLLQFLHMARHKRE